MLSDPIFRAWGILLALSAASVFASALLGTGVPQAVIGAAVFFLAWLKARVILLRYLGLWEAPAWAAGFTWVLGLYGLLMLGLYLIPAFIA
ncbi:hypothetical protein [Roseibium sp.]|uniref:hypothetical protein n=1 Tax=Roseibium sp. TaxID=1936156 RepID=UPI003B5201CC